MTNRNSDAVILAALSPAHLAEVKDAIIQEFGCCNLDMTSAEFYGNNYRDGQRGMRYGYLVFNGRMVAIVDATPDKGDEIVRQFRL